MTPDEIDAMPAGRELDALVAEKVMGLEPCDWQYLPFHAFASFIACPHTDIRGVRPANSGAMPCFDRQKPPVYSTDIAAAWKVVEKLATNDWFQILSGPIWRVELYPPTQTGEQLHQRALKDSVRSYGETAPLAICRAALKVVEAAGASGATPRFAVDSK